MEHVARTNDTEVVGEGEVNHEGERNDHIVQWWNVETSLAQAFHQFTQVMEPLSKQWRDFASIQQESAVEKEEIVSSQHQHGKIVNGEFSFLKGAFPKAARSDFGAANCGDHNIHRFNRQRSACSNSLLAGLLSQPEGEGQDKGAICLFPDSELGRAGSSSAKSSDVEEDCRSASGPVDSTEGRSSQFVSTYTALLEGEQINSTIGSKPNTFVQFFEKPEMVGLAKKVKLFIASVKVQCTEQKRSQISQVEEDVSLFFRKMEGRVISFLEEIETFIRSHPFWSSRREEEISDVKEGIKRLVLTKLYEYLFAQDPAELRVQDGLLMRIQGLRRLVTAEHLQIPVSLRNEMVLQLVQEELRKMNHCCAPVDKLDCIERACSIISNTLSISLRASSAQFRRHPEGQVQGTIGADDFVPALIFATLSCDVPRLYSNLQFIRKFCDRGTLLSHAGYCFTTLESAVQFLLVVDAPMLDIDPDLFARVLDESCNDGYKSGSELVK